MYRAEDIIELMEEMRDDSQRKILMRFFKTGKGEYGEGDEFLGLKVPRTREIVKAAKEKTGLDEIEKLLYCKWHEVRLCGFLLLVDRMNRAIRRKPEYPVESSDEIAEFYLRHCRQANNWDLVDLSCPGIIGQWLINSDADRTVLDRLSESDNLWEQRISIVSNWRLIREDQYDDTLRIGEKLLSHPHDLIRKAVGWMLREVGKRDTDILYCFLKQHHRSMSRTTLRYAIEKLPETERRYWLKL